MPPFSKCYVLSRILVHGANCIEERHAWDTANRHYSRVLHQIPKTSFAGILDYSQNHQKCLCKFPHSNMLWAACLQGLSEQEVVAEGLRLLRSGREETVKGQVGEGGAGRGQGGQGARWNRRAKELLKELLKETLIKPVSKGSRGSLPYPHVTQAYAMEAYAKEAR